MGGKSIYATDAPVESLRLAAVALAGAPSPQHVANVLADAAADTLGAASVAVGIREEPGWHIRLLHDRGLSPPARQRVPAVLSALEQAPVRSEGAALDALAKPLLAPRSLHRGRPPSASGMLAVLIPPRERPLGIVLVGRAGPISAQERRFLDAVAAIAALALEHLGSPGGRRAASTGAHVQLAGMQIDLADQEVIVDDRRVRLTPCELRILLFLAAEPGRAQTRREILRHVWHTEHVGDERACDAHISNLRKKIERDPSRPSRVVTVRNVGYALRLPRIS